MVRAKDVRAEDLLSKLAAVKQIATKLERMNALGADHLPEEFVDAAEAMTGRYGLGLPAIVYLINTIVQIGAGPTVSQFALEASLLRACAKMSLILGASGACAASLPVRGNVPDFAPDAAPDAVYVGSNKSGMGRLLKQSIKRADKMLKAVLEQSRDLTRVRRSANDQLEAMEVSHPDRVAAIRERTSTVRSVDGLPKLCPRGRS